MVNMWCADDTAINVCRTYIQNPSSQRKQIVSDRNGRKSSKLLVEFKAKTIKDKIPLRKQVRENRNSRGAVNVCDDEGLTRVAEFPQSCRHRKR
ncbi:hypothetical protein ACROYT_G022302 [Oculina patagonica]